MKSRSRLYLGYGFLMLGMLFFQSCGITPRTAIFVGETDPADFSLSNTKPESFAFEVPAGSAATFDFAVELTYFENQMQGWDALPLSYTLTFPDGKEEKKPFLVNVHDDKGGWRGALRENLTDRFFEENISKGLKLAPGKYKLDLFGDSPSVDKPILGIVHVAFKVYAY